MRKLAVFGLTMFLSLWAAAQGITASGVFIGMGPAAGAAPPPGIVIVSETTNFVNNTGSTLTTTIPATTAGNCIVIVAATYHGHITGGSTNSISAGAAFQITTNAFIGAAGTFTYVEGYFIKNVGAGITTVTITTTSDGTGSGFQAVHIFEISGLSTTAPYTGTERIAANGQINTSTQDTGGQINNATANSIYFAGGTTDGVNIFTTINASGTDGTWVELANSRLAGDVSAALTAVTQIVSTSSARKHVWNRVNNTQSTAAIEFVLHQ